MMMKMDDDNDIFTIKKMTVPSVKYTNKMSITSSKQIYIVNFEDIIFNQINNKRKCLVHDNDTAMAIAIKETMKEINQQYTLSIYIHD